MSVGNNFDKVSPCPVCGGECEQDALIGVWGLTAVIYKCMACGHGFGEIWNAKEDTDDEG